MDFVTAAEDVIWTKEIGTISIPLANRNNIELHNVALAPGCDSNLISLSQLQETGIIYHNDLIAIKLIKQGKVIAQVKKTRNLFMFDLV